MESKFKKGSRVSHPKYGTGTITTVNGDYDRCHIRRDADDELVNLLIEGLTLLDAPEYDRAGMAAMAMCGLISSGERGSIWEDAVHLTDQLIAELQRTEK